MLFMSNHVIDVQSIMSFMSNHFIHVTIHVIHDTIHVIHVMIHVHWSSNISKKASSIKSGKWWVGCQKWLPRPSAHSFAVGRRQKPLEI
jgi:hypothetical protein